MMVPLPQQQVSAIAPVSSAEATSTLPALVGASRNLPVPVDGSPESSHDTPNVNIDAKLDKMMKVQDGMAKSQDEMAKNQDEMAKNQDEFRTEMAKTQDKFRTEILAKLRSTHDDQYSFQRQQSRTNDELLQRIRVLSEQVDIVARRAIRV